MMMRRQDAEAIAQLVAAVRPEWDTAGILAALRKVRDRELVDVARAALTAAADVSNRTPAVIALAGPHWASAGQRQALQPPRLNERCKTHLGWGANCPGCRADAIAAEDVA